MHLDISMLTICGISELSSHADRKATHVLSLLDAGTPDIAAFENYAPHARTTLRFDDIIQPMPDKVMPTSEIVDEILAFGARLTTASNIAQRRVLIHCHQGISRSTAAMLTILAQQFPDDDETIY
ncbi:tyrosine phosphatase family protein [Paracoccus versutus]|uniref:tyrosine phosphatase family protein n=1 Tax=Paracoccus versutus TaxID=34007 RepID=UPI001AA02EF9|nr:hypothetical protein [Paracoccus versutus]